MLLSCIDRIPKKQVLRLADILIVIVKALLCVAALFVTAIYILSFVNRPLVEHVLTDPSRSSFFLFPVVQGSGYVFILQNLSVWSGAEIYFRQCSACS